jgi:hypothetical protein
MSFVLYVEQVRNFENMCSNETYVTYAHANLMIYLASLSLEFFVFYFGKNLAFRSVSCQHNALSNSQS